MGRSLSSALAPALALSLLLPAAGWASERALPMQFELRRQGPADSCGSTCRLLISAAGAITADTPADFLKFAQSRDLSGALIVLDSDGGSVRGAIALGREIRRLSLDTMVGRVVDIAMPQPDEPRAMLSPRADCESMCAFVLLAGVHRSVPPQARVMVHQIWLGNRRDDPTAASYSAEDLVLVQHDVGRLVRYTADMGGSMDMLDLALRIPPWEPMHTMTRAELARMRVVTEEPGRGGIGTIAAVLRAPVPQHVTDDVPTTDVSERRWAMINRPGAAALARRHPLTMEGESIGSFDLLVSCSVGGSYHVSYIERRHSGVETPLPVALKAITLRAAGRETSLEVVSTERRSHPDELITYAAGAVPAALVEDFAAFGNHSLTIETQSAGVATSIRLGNTGARQLLPQLAARCAKPLGVRAELGAAKTGGVAAGQ